SPHEQAETKTHHRDRRATGRASGGPRIGTQPAPLTTQRSSIAGLTWRGVARNSPMPTKSSSPAIVLALRATPSMAPFRVRSLRFGVLLNSVFSQDGLLGDSNALGHLDRSSLRIKKTGVDSVHPHDNCSSLALSLSRSVPRSLEAR